MAWAGNQAWTLFTLYIVDLAVMLTTEHEQTPQSALIVLFAPACGTDGRGPPALSEAATRSQAVFMHQCNHCHPRGQAGLGFALNNKPLPGPLIAFQVRRGLGAMPTFPEEVISDAALDDLVIYLRELRRGG